MADVQVRGCCCGIPFGCGTLMFLGAGIALWSLTSPKWLAIAGIYLSLSCAGY